MHIRFFLLFFAFIISNNSYSNIDQESLEKNFDIVKSYLYYYHINNKKLKSWSSVDVFNNFIEVIDKDKLIFSEQDMIELESVRNSFVDVFKDKKTRDFALKNFYFYYKIKHFQSKQIFLDILDNFSDDYFSNDLNYQIKNKQKPKDESDKYLLHKKNFIYITIDHKENIEKRIKYLKNYFDKEYNPLTFDEFQLKLLHSFAQSLDSHSGVYSPLEFSDFKMSVNNKLEGGIGIRYEINDDGFAKITYIKENTPASKNKTLKENGIILGIIIKDEKIYFNTLKKNEIANHFLGKTGDFIKLIYKTDDSSKEEIVSLLREDIVLDDNRLKFNILKNNNNKYGYLKFDAFYSGNSEKMTDDICFDFYKLLKKEENNIDGLIIDLRDNGGGFLNSSLCMLDYLLPNKHVLSSIGYDKDVITNFVTEDKGFFFNKPLVLYINGNSASASEIFAGVLQEYGRAIIIGSQSYGKGTIQNIINLPYGTLKYTSGKFYLPSGKSTQLEGIEPDINIPDYYDSFYFGENSLKNHLSHDYIKKDNYKIDKMIFDKKTKLKITKKTTNFLKNQNLDTINDFYKFVINYDKKDEVSLDYNKRKNENLEFENKKDLYLKKIYKKNKKLSPNLVDLDNDIIINIDPILNELAFITFNEVLSD